jgi:hypothetical protein
MRSGISSTHLDKIEFSSVNKEEHNKSCHFELIYSLILKKLK